MSEKTPMGKKEEMDWDKDPKYEKITVELLQHVLKDVLTLPPKLTDVKDEEIEETDTQEDALELLGFTIEDAKTIIEIGQLNDIKAILQYYKKHKREGMDELLIEKEIEKIQKGWKKIKGHLKSGTWGNSALAEFILHPSSDKKPN